MKAAVSEGLSLSLGYTYTEATTTEPVTKSDLNFGALIPDLGGKGPTDTTVFLTLPDGASLPGVPRNSGTLGIDYSMPLGILGRSDWMLLLHADAAYRSTAAGALDVTRPYYWTVPSSTVTNARASRDPQ